MGISSLGMGSGVLTQDLLDQLRQADEASRVTPIDRDIYDTKNKKNSLEVLDASMTNLIDSIGVVNSNTLYADRIANVDSEAVSIEVDNNTDEQAFTLEVTQLATKQIEESGSFSAADESIADDDGTITLSIDGEDFDIDYTSDTTLEDMKKAINDVAGDKVSASIVKLGDDDYRLFITSVGTGENQDISITDNDGNLKDTSLTDDLDAVQEAQNAQFKINGEDVERETNKIDDLITGVHITLNEVGTSNVEIAQDKDKIVDSMNKFVEKYNDTMKMLNDLTKTSMNEDERGVFSNESTIKGLKRDLANMLDSVGEGMGSLSDYGFEVDKDGVLSFDSTTFKDKLEENPSNTAAFFAGGTFINKDGDEVELKGTFNEIGSRVEEYTKYNATLDQFKDSLNSTLDTLEDRRLSAIERLDSKYETLKKQFAAYDIMMSKLNSASAMFTQMTQTNQNSDN